MCVYSQKGPIKFIKDMDEVKRRASITNEEKQYDDLCRWQGLVKKLLIFSNTPAILFLGLRVLGSDNYAYSGNNDQQCSN